ncbi:ubiquinone/menaquinone biosynthesis C-methylase UbiE [Kibdelosporangium banguiense]|uniref:Ubiquinone/menaquinone biosynthesis C-methylase UbiE n=1 Tax=Kibdelosporangium banguiense TaxID=1365924 RepID=A0ABS4TRR2_9PSEU|nr:class I SAM-dependent methyltransferase [Kibdelosporangium banguiense]MBP2327088.1 ubiquinone/menaquinone biosynthesis C-methylase UbiE [Kibdelosporangium banguiense]
MHGYALDNAAGETVERFNALESCYDTATRDSLRRTGLAGGWNCLEIGAGGGSIALWLSDMTGPDGRVTVTDIAPGQLAPGLLACPNVQVLRHDVVNDALPEAEFDLIHARLVLLHLPERRAVLQRLVRSLRPGGWLVLDEFDCSWTPVLMTPYEGAEVTFERVHAGFLESLTESGADVTWGRKLFGEFVRAGLSEVSSTTFAMAWPGGSAGASLHHANTTQLADRIQGHGVPAEDLHLLWSLLEDPRFAVQSYPMVSACGRRER